MTWDQLIASTKTQPKNLPPPPQVPHIGALLKPAVVPSNIPLAFEACLNIANQCMDAEVCDDPLPMLSVVM